MIEPDIPKNEEQRLNALKEYQVLDTLPEQLYDDITLLASQICNTPISLISLIDDSRQWFKSHHGLGVDHTPKNIAYCAHAINEPEKLMEVEDALKDERFHDNPLATGEPFVRFYAGMPLVDENGFALGTLCVIDHKPRKLNDAQKESLKALSRQVLALLKLRVESNKKQDAFNEFIGLVENLGDGVFELDEHGKCIYANATMLKFLNRDIDEVMHTSIWDMIYHEDVPSMKAFYADQFRNRRTKCYYEYRVAPKNGDPIWLAQTTTMTYEGDTMVRLRSISRNLSETKELEIELEEKDQLYRLVSENSSDLIALHEPNGHYRFVAPSSFDLVGYKPSELIGKNPYNYIHPDDVARLQSGPHQQTLQGGKASSIEYRFRSKSGKYIWLESYTKPIINSQGEVTSFQTSSRDITEKVKEQERNLRYRVGLKLLNELSSSPTSEHLVSKALQKATNHLNLSNALIALKNPADELEWIYFFGGSDKKNIQLPQIVESELISEIISSSSIRSYYSQSNVSLPFTSVDVKKLIGSRILRSGRSIGAVCIWSEKEEGPFPAQDKAFVLLFANWLGASLETLEDRKQLLESKIIAESANAAKSDFLSMMSHEIRTPLNGIIGTTHLLLNKSPQKELLPYFDILQQSSNNLLAIVNDILDFNKIQEGKVNLESINFELKKMIENILKNYVIPAEEKHLKLNCEYDQNLHKFYWGDSVRISQVLHNLVSNAIKFTSEGSITIKTSARQTLDSFQEIHFEVIDTGIGIPKERQNEIFDKFTQASSSTSREYGGSGLGLTITKNLLNMMGSEIKLKSEPGTGSNFSFTLVLKISEEETIQEETFENLKLKGTVLIVEDNAFNRIIAKDFLEAWGCRTIEAENGEECLEVLKSEKADLILMDLQMPVLDGFETSKVIRASDDLQEIPIVALTAEVIGDVKEKVYEHQMNDYITKPFHPTEFFKKVQKHLKLKQDITNNDLVSVVLNKLKKTLGDDHDVVMKYYDIFIKATEEEKDKLGGLINKEDISAIRSYVHKVKSSFQLAGLKDLTEEALEIERLIDEGGAKNIILDHLLKHNENLEATLELLKESNE